MNVDVQVGKFVIIPATTGHKYPFWVAQIVDDQCEDDPDCLWIQFFTPSATSRAQFGYQTYVPEITYKDDRSGKRIHKKHVSSAFSLYMIIMNNTYSWSCAFFTERVQNVICCLLPWAGQVQQNS